MSTQFSPQLLPSPTPSCPTSKDLGPRRYLSGDSSALNQSNQGPLLPLWAEHRAVTDYSGQSDTEMSLKAGDVVTVVEALESGWWLGCHGDQVGWFPGDRVEVSACQSTELWTYLSLIHI